MNVTMLLTSVLGFSFVGSDATAPPPGQPAELHATHGSEPILYRRIFVPADNLEVWPRDGLKFLPIDARELESNLAAANRRASKPVASIDKAEYFARLDNGQRLEGQGRWTIALHPVATTGDAQESRAAFPPVFLPLDPMSLVVRDPRWRGAQQPARLGLWGPAGGSPQTSALEVREPGVLEFDWRARADRIDDTVEIPWIVPTATSTTLLLDLPEGREPSIEGGVVVASRAAYNQRRRWELALAGTVGSVLRITGSSEAVRPPDSVDLAKPEDAWRAANHRSESPALEDDIHYEVTQRGVAVTTIWHIDDSHARRELRVPLPADLLLISMSASADIDDGAVPARDLSWRTISRSAATEPTGSSNTSPSGPSDARTAIIDLTELADTDRSRIVVHAWQPLVLGRAQKLPKLRPKDVFWTAGSTRLSVAPELELHDVTSQDYVQTGVDWEEGKRGTAEALTLSAYSPDAELQIVLSRRRSEVAVRLGSTLTLADPDVNGRLVSQWSVPHGSVHRLSGVLATGWIVEAVETDPVDALKEWFVDRRGGRHLLEIQLAQAVRPGRPVSAIVTGRLQRAHPADPMSVDALRMVHWPIGNVARHLLKFQSADPYTLEPAGGLATVDRDTIATVDQALLGDSGGDDGPIFDLTRGGDDAGLRLGVKRGQYEAEIWLDATFAEQKLWQTHHFVVTPTEHRVDRLLVFFTAPLDGEWRWSDASTGDPLTAETLPRDDPGWTGLPKGGELWLVRLGRPTSQAIEISASVTSDWRPQEPIPLAVLPDAIRDARDTGRVLLRGQIGNMPPPQTQHMSAIPLPLTARDPIGATSPPQPIRAAYRYNLADSLTDRRAARLSMGPIDSSANHLLIARHVELESYFWSDGRGTHRATYHLENEGATHFELSHPEPGETTVRSVRVEPTATGGRASLDQPMPNTTGEPLPIRLPTPSRTATVTVTFETQQPSLVAGRRLHPPPLPSDVPVLASRWTIWLPEEFTARGPELVWPAERRNWRQRLFGPLGRPAEARPFHPFRSADWTMLAASAADLPDPPDAQPAGGHYADTAALPGWHAVQMQYIAGPPAPLTISHPPAIAAVAIAAFLACLAAGRALAALGKKWFIIALAAAVGASLLLPETLAPLATGALLGLLASLVVLAVNALGRRRPSADSASHEWSRGSTVSMAGLTAIALGVSFVCPSTTAGEPATSQNARSAANVHRILIPVDANGRPTGDKVFVSDPFLQELLRASSEPNGEAPPDGGDWLLLDAHYEGQVRSATESSDGQEAHLAAKWTMRFAIDVLTRDSTVVLPLSADQADWSTTAMLDGVPTPLAWCDTRRGCVIEIAEPGRYWLSITGTPHTAQEQGRAQLRLSIPPLPGTSLRLFQPTSLRELEVRGATRRSAVPDRVPRDEPIQTIEYELNGDDELVILWPRRAAPESAPGLRVSGLRWLRIAESGIEMEIKYVVQGNVPWPEKLAVRFDRKWQLVHSDAQSDDLAPNAADDNGPNGGRLPVVDEARNVRLVHVPLSPGDTDRQEVTLRWRLSGVRPLGRLRLPPIELLNLPITERWLAVSSAPALDCEVSGGSLSAGTISDFLAAWGNDAVSDEAPSDAASDRQQGARDLDVPQFVLTGLPAGAAWNLAIQPRRTTTAIDEVLHLSVGSRDGLKIRVVYQADVSPSKAHEFQLPLLVPAGMAIHDVALSNGGTRVPVRWARVADDRVHVFFAEQAATEYRLVLTGEMRLDDEESGVGYPLPVVAAAALVQGRSTYEATGALHVRLHREVDVLVEIRGLPAEIPAPVAEESADDVSERSARSGDHLDGRRTARPVASFRADAAAAAQVRLAIEPNQLELSGQMLTTLTRLPDQPAAGGPWWAGFAARLSVERGQLDTLRLRVPTTWAGPFTVQSDVPATAEISSQDGQPAELSVRFARSIAAGDAVDLTIRGPLAGSSPAQASVPDIEPSTRFRGQRFAQVPLEWDGQQLSWSQQGVRPALIPDHLAELARRTLRAAPAQRDRSEQHSPAADGKRQTFEIIDTPLRVALQPREHHQYARIRLADTTVRAGPTGGQVVLTRFLVEPHGLAECTLQLPTEHELIGVYLDGVPAALRHNHPNEWQVAVGPTRLPRLMEVISSQQAPPTATRHQLLQRPSLLADQRSGAGFRREPIPIEVTLWSYGVASRAPARAGGTSGEPAAIVLPNQNAAAVSPVDHAALRLDRLVSVAETATTTAVDVPTPDGWHWFGHWAALLEDARQDALQATDVSRQMLEAAQVTRASEEQLTEASLRLDEWIEHSMFALSPAGDDPLLDADDLPPRHEVFPGTSRYADHAAVSMGPPSMPLSPVTISAESWIYCVADGGADHLTIKRAGPPVIPRQVQVAGLAAVLGLLAAGLLLARRPSGTAYLQLVQEVLYRWPHAAALLLGIAVWAWLWPSWLGVLIALASAVLALRSLRPGRSLALDVSTVIRREQQA